MSWTVRYRNTKQIEKAVFKMRPSVRRAFAEAISDLIEQGPRPYGWHTKELQGNYKDMMSLRLDIRHRMIYSVFSKSLLIEIVEVTTRENAYK
ncbi:MAG: hypothetical protein HYU97_03630 [Deltaproteobacteria bacterium]|nr:hypothetical protein [Deltaproteobacteria bacterium]